MDPALLAKLTASVELVDKMLAEHEEIVWS